jgi:hypothetical protein
MCTKFVQAIFSVSKVYPNNAIKNVSGKQNVGYEARAGKEVC